MKPRNYVMIISLEIQKTSTFPVLSFVLLPLIHGRKLNLARLELLELSLPLELPPQLVFP